MNLKGIYHKIMHSFSLRLSIYIVSVATVIFIVAFALNFHSARTHVKEETMERAKSELENTVLQIDNVLSSVETAINNLSWLVMENLGNPDYMYTLTEMVLRGNPHVYGSAIAFEPYYYREKGLFWSPFSYRKDGKILNKQLGTVDYDYHFMDWYQIPKLLGKPYWSEPYHDEGGADVIMSTYSCPLYDNDGKLFAVFTADISLQWFAFKVNSMKPYPNSLNYMIGRGGTYLVHPNSDAILNESIFANAIYNGNTLLKETAHKMTSGESGMAEFKEDEGLVYYFYTPIPSVGWSVAVACLRSDILGSLDHMTIIISIIGLLGLLLMGALCHYTIRKLTSPLARFADSAREIAGGTFDAPLPEISGKDEMKTLHDSFSHMQVSLVDYVQQLQETTANKERIESELRIARDIQMGMVPKTFPNRSDIDLYAALQPAKEVGGDLYDFFIEDEKLYFIIGDVSGKGVPASLVMAVTCRLFRTLASHAGSPQMIAQSLNNTLADNNDSNMFCTAFIGILDLKSGELKYCNAGHNAPVLMDSLSGATMLEVEPNLPLGLFEEFPYQEQMCTIGKNTAMFLYTDGVTEAENMEKALYTEERLLGKLSKLYGKTSEQIINGIIADVGLHSTDTEQSDDITVLCFKYLQAMEKELILFNRREEIAKLAPFIEEFAAQAGLAEELVFSLNLALEEAVSNVVLYAYPPDKKHTLTLVAKRDGDTVTFILSDTGKEFDPTAAPEADITLSAQEREIGGLGIFLVKQIMDSVEYQRIENKNILTLKKLI